MLPLLPVLLPVPAALLPVSPLVLLLGLLVPALLDAAVLPGAV
ncbi:MAG TPA: hypothetical protein VN089_20340 [Duganella sp.]|nr:hypothetical protein [Duganella sp.]